MKLATCLQLKLLPNLIQMKEPKEGLNLVRPRPNRTGLNWLKSRTTVHLNLEFTVLLFITAGQKKFSGASCFWAVIFYLFYGLWYLLMKRIRRPLK